MVVFCSEAEKELMKDPAIKKKYLNLVHEGKIDQGQALLKFYLHINEIHKQNSKDKISGIVQN